MSQWKKLLVNVCIDLEWEDFLNMTPNTETIKAKTDTFNSKFKNFCALRKSTE